MDANYRQNTRERRQAAACSLTVRVSSRVPVSPRPKLVAQGVPNRRKAGNTPRCLQQHKRAKTAPTPSIKAVRC